MRQVKNFKYSTNDSTSIDNFYTLSTAVNGFGSNSFFSSVQGSAKEVIQFENGKYSIFSIANWFLLKGEMTHKKLQKLCYYAQAWCYALKGYRLVNSDFQAWVHGPVSPALYDRFKCFRYNAIRIKLEHNPEIEPEDIELLENIWDTYGDKTGNALEALSHRELPWMEARRGYATDERCTVVINPETMRDYYRSIFIGGE